MKKRFLGFVGEENVSDEPEDLDAYSYCASGTLLKPQMIVWPQSMEQVRRIMLHASQTHTPLTLRGSGTSHVDGCIGENTVILSSERMNKLMNLDLKNRKVEVEAGMRLSDLNIILAEFNMTLPFFPRNPACTIGGLIAINAVSKESQSIGRFGDWVEMMEFVDGTGKYFHTRKKELVIGREGLSGFITRATLRITEQQPISLDLFGTDNLSELLGKVKNYQTDKEIYFMEYFDVESCGVFGFQKKYLLAIAYNSMKGKITELLEVKSLLSKISSVHSRLRSKGYFYVADAQVSLEKSFDIIAWCENNKIALQGHIGLGLFYIYFKQEDDVQLSAFHALLEKIGGRPGMIFGIGSAHNSSLTAEEKKELVRLKDEYDYNNILNPGKLISYR